MESGSLQRCPVTSERKSAETETQEVPSGHQETLSFFAVRFTEHRNGFPGEGVGFLALEALIVYMVHVTLHSPRQVVTRLSRGVGLDDL